MRISEKNVRKLIRKAILEEHAILNEGKVKDVLDTMLSYGANKLINFTGKDELILAYELTSIIFSKREKANIDTDELQAIFDKYASVDEEVLNRAIRKFKIIAKELESYKKSNKRAQTNLEPVNPSPEMNSDEK